MSMPQEIVAKKQMSINSSPPPPPPDDIPVPQYQYSSLSSQPQPQQYYATNNINDNKNPQAIPQPIQYQPQPQYPYNTNPNMNPTPQNVNVAGYAPQQLPVQPVYVTNPQATIGSAGVTVGQVQSPSVALPSPSNNYDLAMGQQFQQSMYARCARGDHDVVTKYGVCGIAAAVILFPIGLLFLLIDRERRCARCGTFLGT
ncbi:hypothetical protein C8Q75DRAFT_806854 [Abortiporus biennis]|nr:hypothetical protein C8Q75DRAFT_806854 [Abortiporus biennis]